MDVVDININEQPEHYYEYVAEKSPDASRTGAKQKAMNSLKELEGWCSEYKSSLLMDLIFTIQPEIVVEVGVFGGKSLIPIAFALKENQKGKIYGIDPWEAAESVVGMDGVNEEYWAKVDYEAILQGLLRKIDKWNLQDQIELMRTTSEGAYIGEEIDLIHIDGNHSEASALFDVEKWVPLVKKGGVIIFDDIDWETTRAAQDWLNTHCRKLLEINDSNICGIWLKL